MKLTKAKLTLVLCAVLALFFFTNDFALIDIEKTAIVVALGVDESEDGYEVTAQIALPQATDTASSNDDAVLSARGKTMFEAIENVASKSGWYAKLSFCGLVILGRKVAERSASDLIDYIVASEKFENSTIAVVSDTTAKEVLLATTPLDAISSFALQKIVLKNEWMTSPVNVTNVKKFAVSTYSESRAAYLPVVKIIKGDNKGKEGSSSAVTAAAEDKQDSGGDKKGDTSGESGKKDETVVFDASSSALFKDGKYVSSIPTDESRILTILTSPVKNSYFSARDGSDTYYFRVTLKKKSVSVKVDGEPTVEYRLGLTAKLVDSTAHDPLDRKKQGSRPDDRLIALLKEKIEKTVESLHDDVSECDCDVLGVKDKIYKFHNSRYEDLRNAALSSFGKVVKVDVLAAD